MIPQGYILADAPEPDLIRLLPFLAFPVIAIVLGLLKKAAEKAQEARRREAEERAGRQAATRKTAAPQTERAAPTPPAAPEPRATRRAPPPRPDLEAAREALRSMGIVIEQAPRPPRQPPRPAPQKPIEPRPVTLDEELRRQRHRERQLKAERRRRLEAPKSPEADTAAIESRIHHVRRPGVEGSRPAAGASPTVDLSERKELRRAILFHEIFSPPKGLRRGGEMWDV